MNYLEFLTLAANEPQRIVAMSMSEWSGSMLMHARCGQAWLGSIRGHVFPLYAERVALYEGDQIHKCTVCSQRMQPCRTKSN